LASKRRKNEGRPSKRAGIDHNSDEIETMTETISAAVTAKVLENLKDSGFLPFPLPQPSTVLDVPTVLQNTASTSGASNLDSREDIFIQETGQHGNMICILAQNLLPENSVPQYRPLDRPLYTKINKNLFEIISSQEFIDMSDILVDHQPIDLDFHFQVQNKKSRVRF